MSEDKNCYEINQKGRDYVVLIDLLDNELIIKCINKSSGDFFSSKKYKLEDLHSMNKYFRIADNIKEIQSLLNSAIEQTKIGLLEDFNQMTIFFYLMLGLEQNTIAFTLIKGKDNFTVKNSILKELRNYRDEKNYLETLENIIEKIEGENYLIKQKAIILSERLKKLNIESDKLKKESLLLKENNDLLRKENMKLMEYKKKYETVIRTPFKSESEFKGEMKIANVADEFFCCKKRKEENKSENIKNYDKLDLNYIDPNNDDDNNMNIIDNDNYENESENSVEIKVAFG